MSFKVYEAICNITSDLSKVGISKERTNQQQGYKFRGIDDVYGALSPLLAKHKLCVLTRAVEKEVVERQTKNGGVLFYTTLRVEFDFVSAEDGSKHTIITYGEAMDSGDKSCNKALSAAYKYAAMQAFCIPTEGDNDADAQTHEVAPITPSTGVWEAMDVDEQAFLQRIANEVAEFIKEGDLQGAVGHVRAQKLGPEEQAALNTRFDSKQRSAMKKWIQENK